MLVYKFIFLLLSAVLATSRDIQRKHLFNDGPTLGIVNGTEVVPHSIPYQVVLSLTQNQDVDWYCTGTLIASNYILTTAKCISRATNGVAFLGVHRFGDSLPNEIIPFNEFLVHDNYDNLTNQNDIGLIKLVITITTSSRVQFAPLPSKSEIDVNYVGVNGRTSGWGWTSDDFRSSVLLAANSTIIKDEKCDRSYGPKLNTICLSADKGGSPCVEDSGAPFVVDNIQVGLVSYGSCSKRGLPSVIIRIDKYLGWIEANSNWKPL